MAQMVILIVKREIISAKQEKNGVMHDKVWRRQPTRGGVRSKTRPLDMHQDIAERSQDNHQGKAVWKRNP